MPAVDDDLHVAARVHAWKVDARICPVLMSMLSVDSLRSRSCGMEVAEEDEDSSYVDVHYVDARRGVPMPEFRS
jgi:hypothetical protein